MLATSPPEVISRAARGLVAALACCALSPNAGAEEKVAPAGALELIVPFGPGGGADTLARTAAALLAGSGSAPMQVVNVPGATGTKGIARLMAAPADGRTWAVLTGETFALLAYANPGWKLADVTPVAVLLQQPSALFLPAGSRFKNWAEFEKEARLRPDTLRVAINGLGSPDYLMLQQLAAKGVKLVPVPSANPEERYRAPAEDRADALYEQPGDVLHLLTAQQLQPALVFGAARLDIFPAVPSSRELGFGDGFDQFRAIVVKAGTDPSVVKALSTSLDKLVSMPSYRDYLAKEKSRPDGYVSNANIGPFLQGKLEVLKKLVDVLPFHARHLYTDDAVHAEVQQF